MNRTNNSELYERVTAAGKFFGGLPAFAEMIGVQYRTFHAYLSAKRQHNLWPLLPTMLEAFPRLSRQWLYFGEGPTPEEEIASRAGWENVTAVKNGKILNLQNNELSRPSPRLAVGAQEMYDFVYGE